VLRLSLILKNFKLSSNINNNIDRPLFNMKFFCFGLIVVLALCLGLYSSGAEAFFSKNHVLEYIRSHVDPESYKTFHARLTSVEADYGSCGFATTTCSPYKVDKSSYKILNPVVFEHTGNYACNGTGIVYQADGTTPLATFPALSNISSAYDSDVGAVVSTNVNLLNGQVQSYVLYLLPYSYGSGETCSYFSQYPEGSPLAKTYAKGIPVNPHEYVYTYVTLNGARVVATQFEVFFSFGFVLYIEVYATDGTKTVSLTQRCVKEPILLAV